MISSKKIKKSAKEENKKIGKDAIKLIEEILELRIKELIKKASKNASFSGRGIIKKEDIAP